MTRTAMSDRRRRRCCAVVIGFAVASAAPAVLAQTRTHAPTSPQHRDENGEALARGLAAIQGTFTYNSDANADVGGGGQTGGAYLQRIGVIADADLDRAAGWRGATAHLSLHAIDGVGLTGRRVDNILTVSGIEAEPALRLFNLWIEQRAGDRLTVRVGQFTAAQEFAISAAATLFINSTFGWPASFASDLPSGGPAYPLASPGLRAAWRPDDRTIVRAAVFSGDPAGKGGGDPQRRDRRGLNGFRLKSRPFVIGEVARSAAGPDPAWSIVAGGWVHLDRFDDQRFDVDGRSLASAVSNGRPRRHAGNYAVYAMADRRLWRGGRRSVRGFLRATASPGDRNPVDLYLDGGLDLTSLFRARPDDVAGLGFGLARISPRARSLVRDRAAVSGAPADPPAFEGVIEATYQFKLSDRLYLQPNVQMILHPSGGLLSEPRAFRAPSRRAIVVGVRTSLRL